MTYHCMMIDYFLTQIKPSAADFWADSKTLKYDPSQIMQQRGMYLPCVEMTISLKYADATIKLPIKFTGHNREDDLDVELILPLGRS